jgi:outer membrane protein TolC
MPGIYAFSKKELRTEDLSALDPQGYIGIGLKWSLFDGMQGARDYQKACIERQIAENNYNDAISLLNLQVEKCKSELDVAYQLISVAEKKKITAAKGLQIATRQYELGLGNITERLIAETDLQTAQLEYLQAVYNQRMAVLALLRVQGKLTPDVINE